LAQVYGTAPALGTMDKAHWFQRTKPLSLPKIRFNFFLRATARWVKPVKTAHSPREERRSPDI
jgi:hypothetical protein